MKHTLVAVFNNRADAQKALDDLAASGFARQSVRLSEGDGAGQSAMTSNPASTTAGASATGTGLRSGAASSAVNPDANADAHADDGSLGSSIRIFFGNLFGADRADDVHMYSEAVSRGHHVLTLDAESESEVERGADIVERYGPLDIDEHAQQWGAMGQDTARMSAAGNQQSSMQSPQSATGSMQGSSTTEVPITSAQMTGSPLAGSQRQGSQSQTSQQFQDPNPERAGPTQAIPVIQEQLTVGKREVQRGSVRVYNRVVETPVDDTVRLREEHINVERHAVDRPANPDDLHAFKETTIEVRESAEEAVVEKRARVVEEVIIKKQVTQRQEQIHDTVRRTEVQVEQLTPADDTYFRSHYASQLASSGKPYDDFAPAYGYGSSMARDSKYRGRSWEEIEPDLRSDWEARNAGSAWESMKMAIRHGWARMTS